MNRELKQLIIDKSIDLGFDDCKFTSYTLLDNEIEGYKNWLANGNNATMKWMENNIDKRQDPSLILESIKSVITLAYSYNIGINHPKDTHETNSGKIARYALGTDYHEIIPSKLRELERYIKSINFEAESKSYIDTGPVMERSWANRSGIGWIGKNSLIMNKELGSYFFIAIIFTNLEFIPDSPISDRCGKCTKCITNCPTGAITEQRSVDANKCISFWTIEAKAENEIPEKISKNLKNWVFGCDICQEVCPWNNHRTKIKIDDFLQARNNETTLDLEKIINMNQDEFSKRFSKSPLKRPKLAGMIRNAKAILNNNNL